MDDSSIDESIHRFVTKQLELLRLEYEAEANGGDDENTSRTLRHLDIDSMHVGLYGKTIWTFVADTSDAGRAGNNNNSNQNDNNDNDNAKDKSKSNLLPAHNLTVGDEVEILTNHNKSTRSATTDASEAREKKKSTMFAVVSKVTNESISVVLSEDKKHNNNNNNNNMDDVEAIMEPPFTIRRKVSEDVRRKIEKSLEQLRSHGTDHPLASRVIQTIFGNYSSTETTTTTTTTTAQTAAYDNPSTKMNAKNNPMEPFNSNLDESQKTAIQFALDDERHLALIHGPPGTGKTTAVVELIRQAVFRKRYKVLLCAPSNVAVDNVLARLVVPPVSASAKFENQNQNQKGVSKSRRVNRRKQAQQSSQDNKCTPRVVRLGHPARLQVDVLKHSLEALVQDAGGTDIVQDCTFWILFSTVLRLYCFFYK